MTYSLTDREVRKVLECFRSFGNKSLDEVVGEYNRKYPPSLVRRVIGIKATGRKILPVLKYTITEGMVEAQLLSFTNQVVVSGTEKHYSITKKGIQFLNKKKG